MTSAKTKHDMRRIVLSVKITSGSSSSSMLKVPNFSFSRCEGQYVWSLEENGFGSYVFQTYCGQISSRRDGPLETFRGEAILKLHDNFLTKCSMQDYVISCRNFFP